MVTTSEHAAWSWSVDLGGGVDRRRESACRDKGGPTEGGRRRSPEVGFPNLQSSPALWPQTFLQNTLGDLNSQANLRHSWSLLPPKSQHLRWLSAVYCLADTLALPWALHCSTSASGEAIQYGGDRSCLPTWGREAILNHYYNCLTGEPNHISITRFLSCLLYILDNDAKKDWDLLKRILTYVRWVGNMCEDCCIRIIGPKGFDANLTQRWHDTWICCPVSK